MALFKKKETESKQDVAQAPAEPTVGKGRPTPKRKDAEARNLRPLVPENTKEQRKLAKQKLRERENREYEAMRTGDLNNMPKAERLPWRIYTRDYIDARFNIGEYFIPVALVMLVASVIFTVIFPSPLVSIIIMTLLYLYLFAIVIDEVVMWRKLKKLLIAKYGEQSVARGMRTGSYAWSRSIQFRRWPNHAMPSAGISRSSRTLSETYKEGNAMRSPPSLRPALHMPTESVFQRDPPKHLLHSCGMRAGRVICMQRA